MNQYIITEEDICTIRDYVLGAFYEGENKEKIYDLLKAEFSVVRSHPYNPQAERERVLDKIILTFNRDKDDYYRVKDIIDFLEGLREGKGGEQG